MAQNPPPGYQRVTPYLLYEDARAALDWLTNAFGFRERMRFEEGGRVTHAELEYEEGSIMLGEPGGDFKSPKHSSPSPVLIHVYVDDVDKHHEIAKAAGAEIMRPPADQEYGDRTYAAEDPEGHQWYFATRVKDVQPEEWGAETR